MHMKLLVITINNIALLNNLTQLQRTVNEKEAEHSQSAKSLTLNKSLIKQLEQRQVNLTNSMKDAQKLHGKVFHLVFGNFKNG